MDSRDRYACSKGFLFDEEGYIIGEIDTALGSRTVLGCERFDVVEIADGTVYTEKLWNPDGAIYSCKFAEDCVIYDVSTAALAEGRRGLPVESLQVGDRITVWANTNGEAAVVYVACRTVDVDAYYIPTRKYDTTLKETTRTANAQGYYEVELLKVGETAERTFKTKDKALMSYLDSMTSKTIGLVVDGDIIERVYDSECLFGYSPLIRGGTVPSVTGSIFTRMTYGQPDAVRTSVLDPACKVYNVSEVGQYGTETTLQPFDRIYAHRKPTGEAICIFVTQRRVGLDHLYWNVGRQYDGDAKTTTRAPDADGWYVFTMIHQGKQVTLKTKSKAIASEIDAQSTCVIGLDVRGDVIVNAYSALNTSGGSVTMSGYRVKEIRDDGVVTASYGSGDTYRERMFKIKSDGVIYNVSDAYYSYRGEKVSSLKAGDMILVVTDIYAEAEVVYIRYREADNMYWRTDRYYDTVNKVTTRVPDAEGWYHYDLAVNGAVKAFKTNNKDIATKLDAVSGAFGLVVDGNVIRSYVPTNWVRNVGFVGVTNWEITAINGNKVTVKYTLPGSSNTGKTQTLTLASGAKIYDVSSTAESFGAAAKLKVGDQIRTYQNESNTAHLYVYILHRANREQGIDGYCEHCGQTVHWNPYAGGSITRASGHYYLAGNLDQNTYYYYFGDGNTTAEGATICLHLNGYRILNTVADTDNNARAIYVETDATLNIMGDGSVSGACKQTTRGAMDVRGTLNLCGGNYLSTSTKYPVIQMRHADCIINVYEGAAVGAEGMTATGIYLQTGGLNVYGGRLYGVTKILSNTAVSLAGAPVISRLDLTSGVLATLGELEQQANITVDAADGAFTQISEKAGQYESCFRAAATGKTVKAEGDALCITDATVMQSLKNLLKALCANIIQ